MAISGETTSRPRLQVSLGASLRELSRAAFRFVFPPCCPLCHRDVDSATREVCGRAVRPTLCGICAAEVVPATANRCRRCGLPLGKYLRSEAGCATCRPLKFRFDQVIRLGLYDGLLRAACIRGKAPYMQPLSAALANQLWLAERSELESVQADFVVPVPRYWTRRILQEHHQAETLSRILAQHLRVPHARGLLHKVRLTPDQSDLTAGPRKQNLRHAFAVWFGRHKIAGKTILLVDDILTTGTTANECARVLLRAGAQRVVVAAIAVVSPHRQ